MTELGNRLKEAREELGMSLEDLQEATKIQKRYLKGIEEGNYDMMPGPFYVRAFIKQYAEAVQLDPEQLFEEFKDEVPSTYKDEIPEKLSRVQTKKTISGKSSKIFDVLPKLLVVVFIVGALFVTWYFISKNAGDQASETVDENQQGTTFQQSENLTKAEEEPEQEPEEKADNKEAVESPADDEEGEEASSIEGQELAVVETSGRKSTYELKNADEFILKIVSTGETWISVENTSGNSFFQGMLVKGSEKESETIDLTNEQEIKIIAGNTMNTEIYINDEKLEYAVSPQNEVRQDIFIRYVKEQ